MAVSRRHAQGADDRDWLSLIPTTWIAGLSGDVVSTTLPRSGTDYVASKRPAPHKLCFTRTLEPRIIRPLREDQRAKAHIARALARVSQEER